MIYINIVIILVSFFVLMKAANYFVEASSSLAYNFKVPTFIIGLTVAAFGTSAPELAIALTAASADGADLLFGNVIGSNIINILLILGIAGLIYPFKVHSEVIRREIPILFIMYLALGFVFFDTFFLGSEYNSLTMVDGIILILFFMLFVYYLVSLIRKTKYEHKREKPKYSKIKSIIYIVISLTVVILVSDVLVNSAINLASELGVSQRIISLTIVALGTSLPEVITAVTAARKKEAGLLVGNVIGSNIFNIGIVLGVTSVVAGPIVPIDFNMWDMLMMFATILLLNIVLFKNNIIKRKEAVVLLGFFVLYYVLVLVFS